MLGLSFQLALRWLKRNTPFMFKFKCLPGTTTGNTLRGRRQWLVEATIEKFFFMENCNFHFELDSSWLNATTARTESLKKAIVFPKEKSFLSSVTRLCRHICKQNIQTLGISNSWLSLACPLSLIHSLFLQKQNFSFDFLWMVFSFSSSLLFQIQCVSARREQQSKRIEFTWNLEMCTTFFGWLYEIDFNLHHHQTWSKQWPPNRIHPRWCPMARWAVQATGRRRPLWLGRAPSVDTRAWTVNSTMICQRTYEKLVTWRSWR